MSVQDAPQRASPQTARPADALTPVREALLEGARRDRHDLLDAAARDGRHTVDAARAEADRIREQARAEGERDAEQMRVEQRARARRRARTIVLIAQREELERLREDVRGQVRRMWADEKTRAQIRGRLVAAAHADLGPDLLVEDHPEGGVIATVDHARATYLVIDLAEAAIADLGDGLSGLWTP